MDSLRRKPIKKYLPPIPPTPRPLPTKRPEPSFTYSFSLPPQPPKTSPTPPQFPSPKRTPRKRRHRPLKKILFFLLIGSLLGIVTGFGFLVWRSSQVSRVTFVKDHSGNILTETAKQLIGKKDAERIPLRGETDGRINTLLLGKGGKNYPGQNLTDTIIVASIDVKTKQTALLSLPRDLYVDIPGMDAKTKLNALYTYGQKNNDDPFATIRSAVETITGLPIHYSFVIDYDGFVQIVDALGGINVTVPQDFDDPRYPGPNYSYEHFTLTKGFHVLDGTTALKYVRERHDDPRGDFGRSERQQQVIQAVKNKAFTLGTILNPLTVYSLLGAVQDNIRTDFSLKEIESLLPLIRNIDTANIHTLVVDAWKKESLLRVTHIALENGQNMFALVPRTGNYEEIRTAAKNIFSKDDRNLREEKIRQEKPVVLIMNTTKNASVADNVHDLLSDLGFESISFASAASDETLARTYVKKLSDSGKTYSLDELLKKIPASLTGDTLDDTLPKKIPTETDFAIILGQDIVKNYQWEKSSTEEYLNNTD